MRSLNQDDTEAGAPLETDVPGTPNSAGTRCRRKQQSSPSCWRESHDPERHKKEDEAQRSRGFRTAGFEFGTYKAQSCFIPGAEAQVTALALLWRRISCEQQKHSTLAQVFRLFWIITCNSLKLPTLIKVNIPQDDFSLSPRKWVSSDINRNSNFLSQPGTQMWHHVFKSWAKLNPTSLTITFFFYSSYIYKKMAEAPCRTGLFFTFLLKEANGSSLSSYWDE